MTERSPAPPWQVRVSGRWAISIQSYLAGTVLNVVILSLTGGQIGAEAVQPRDIGRWALLGLVATFIVGTYAMAANATLFRNRRITPVPVWLAIAFHLGVGLIFGVVVVVGGDALIEPSAQSPAVRIIVITLIGLWWGLTSALVLEARDRFNREREALIDQAVDLELATISETEAAMKLRSTIAREAGPALAESRSRVDEALAGFATQSQALLPVEDWWHISQSLRSTADGAIRPLSHQLWDATSRRYPRPRLGRVLTRLVLYQQFAVLPTMTILAIGYLPAGTYAFGLLGGILATLVMAAGAGAVLALANEVMRRAPHTHAIVFAVAFLLTEAFALAYLDVVARLTSRPFTWGPETVGGAIAVAVSTLLPAAYASLNGARDEVLQRFRLDTDRARVTQLANARTMARVTRDAARELHGTVQTRLISCAVAIEQASRSGDVGQFRRALEASIAILDAPLPDPSGDTSSSVAEEIARMCAPWEGLCTFQTDLAPTVAGLRGPVAMAAGRIVEEAVANACRHGLASTVQIRVTMDEGPSLRFEIDDDGTGPKGGAPGLGTSMLAGISRGRVELTPRAEGGSRLTVALPVD